MSVIAIITHEDEKSNMVQTSGECADEECSDEEWMSRTRSYSFLTSEAGDKLDDHLSIVSSTNSDLSSLFQDLESIQTETDEWKSHDSQRRKRLEGELRRGGGLEFLEKLGALCKALCGEVDATNAKSSTHFTTDW